MQWRSVDSGYGWAFNRCRRHVVREAAMHHRVGVGHEPKLCVEPRAQVVKPHASQLCIVTVIEDHCCRSYARAIDVRNVPLAIQGVHGHLRYRARVCVARSLARSLSRSLALSCERVQDASHCPFFLNPYPLTPTHVHVRTHYKHTPPPPPPPPLPPLSIVHTFPQRHPSRPASSPFRNLSVASMPRKHASARHCCLGPRDCGRQLHSRCVEHRIGRLGVERGLKVEEILV